MSQLNILSAVDQVAAHLQAEVRRGRWSETMPGQDRVAVEFGISRKLAAAALRQLEKQGLLVGQGARRTRRIQPPEGRSTQSLRVAILNFQKGVVQEEGYFVDLIHSLTEAGHSIFFSPKSLLDLGMDVNRVARFVASNPSDAWIVRVGSHEVLEWFSRQATPAFALFGRYEELPIAGVKPNKPPAFVAATRKLIELGHRRIVLLCRRVRRLPQPGRTERAFLDELAAHGIPTGDYNLPDWEDDMPGFHKQLNALFQLTPPTALIIDEAFLFFATQVFLARRGLRVPEDVSLVCTDPNQAYQWCSPSISHIVWDSRPVVQRIVRWVANVSRGKEDRRQTLTKAEFVAGGSIGPAPGL